ncbi:MAG: amidase [Alphaproteobacteria bacterium]|nr:amidase [Alphaproteobacteria bacterium]
MTHTLTSFFNSVPRFRDGGDTPRAYLERCLETIAAREPDVRAFVCLDEANARAAADEATARYRQGRPLSPIDGCPVAVKDIIETADLPTQMNSRIFEGWQPNRDAACVYALRQGGAVILGKTVTTEFATAASGPTRNPNDLTRTPGGSSSGSAAAVAAGMAPVALGTQTAGSILRPAAYCGVHGFKPSHAALNIGGIHPLSNSHDTLGTIAGSLADAWVTARYIAELVGGTPPHPGLDGPTTLPAPEKPSTLALLRTEAWPTVDPDTAEAFDRALGQLRSAGVAIADAESDAAIAALETLLEGVDGVARTIAIYERRWPFLEYLHRYPDRLSPEAADRSKKSAEISREEFLTAYRQQEAIRLQIDSLRDQVDGFVSLTAAGPAPVGLEHTGDRSFQIFWTLTGTPSFTLPRLTAGGLPVGLQVMGFRDADAALAGTAHWIDTLLAG